MTKVFKEPQNYIERVLMRSISRMKSSNWAEEGTPIAVGDTISAIKFDTSKTGELVTFLTTLFTNNPESEQINLITYDNDTTDEISPEGIVLGAAKLDNGVYTLITAKGDLPVPIYATGEFDLGGIIGVEGWQNLDENNTYTLTESYTVTEIADAFAPINGVIVSK